MEKKEKNLLETVINGVTYSLAATLRVAYAIQGKHNHTPYSKVFESMTDMPIEQQIGMIYQSFKIANPEESTQISEIEFMNYYLDNFTLNEVMDQLGAIIEGIIGKSADDESAEAGATSEGN